MENPSFYAIIPADVRYSPIMANAKLLYGEITALANKTGYCYASNAYFSSLYNVDSRQVIKWIGQLEEFGFISREIDQSKGNIRYISLVNKKTLPSEQKDTTLVNKKTLPSEQKDTYNNTYNNTNNNNIIIIDETVKEKEEENLISFNENYKGFGRKQEKEIVIITDNNDDEEIIDNIDDLRKFLNKGKLMERFYYKIGTEESYERFTSDFFIFCDDNGRKMKKKTIEAKFIAYLKPRYETEEDIKEMINNYRRSSDKKKSIYKAIPEDMKMEQEAEKAKKDIEIAEEIEKTLSKEEKENIMTETNEFIFSLMRGREVNEVVKRRFYLRKVLSYKKDNLVNQ